tara:strand:- start:279 stop:479 length:201 start_codon:yes stop_codon:yes gene_type:complete
MNKEKREKRDQLIEDSAKECIGKNNNIIASYSQKKITEKNDNVEVELGAGAPCSIEEPWDDNLFDR